MEGAGQCKVPFLALDQSPDKLCDVMVVMYILELNFFVCKIKDLNKMIPSIDIT